MGYVPVYLTLLRIVMYLTFTVFFVIFAGLSFSVGFLFRRYLRYGER